MAKKTKITEAFLRLTPHPLKVDDRRTDEGQLGIRKADLQILNKRLLWYINVHIIKS